MNEMLVDHNLKIAIGKLDALKNKLALSNTLKEKSIHLYKKIIEKNIPKGRSVDAMIAATIYAACRDSDTPRTLNDITEATGLRKNSIAKCYRAILVTLNLQMPVSDINQCVLRIGEDMDISEKVKQHTRTILDNAKKRNHLAGKDPMGVAAAAIYLASIDMDEKISQGDIARTAMLTEVTIRNRCKGLRSLEKI
ncbi:MAG: transcription initiation factor IIB family protein [Nitrosopumilus sp.]